MKIKLRSAQCIIAYTDVLLHILTIMVFSHMSAALLTMHPKNTSLTWKH